MSTTLDDFLKAKSEQEIDALLEAQRRLDPYTYLNTKFSVEEAQRFRGEKYKGELNTLGQKILAERNARLSNLKSKTSSALEIRRQKFNETYKEFLPHSNLEDPWSVEVSKLQDLLDRLGYNSREGYYLQEIENPNKGFNRMTAMNTARNRFMPSIVIDVLNQCFPSVRETEFYEYPHLFAYAEEIPWPTPEEFDSAFKLMIGWGSEEYAKDALAYMEDIHAKNSNPNSQYNTYFIPIAGNPYFNSGSQLGESTYALPTRNKNYNPAVATNLFNQQIGRKVFYWDRSGWPDSAKDLKSYDMSIHYYSARPKPGFHYVAKVGYLNPLYLTPAYFVNTYSSYGWKSYLTSLMSRRRRSGGIFGGAVKALGKIAGTLVDAVNPVRIHNEVMSKTPVLRDIFREVENVTGGLFTQVESVSTIPSRAIQGEGISERDWMQALDLGIKVAVIVGSAGSASAATSQIGLVSSQLQRGSLGKTELGRSLLMTGEVLAASAVLNQSISNAAMRIGEREGIKAGTREIGNLTDLNQTIIGNIALEAAMSSGQSAAHGGEWGSAFAEGVKSGGLTELAKENPVLGLITSAGIAMIENPGLADTIDMNDPESAFDSFSWDLIPTSFSDLSGLMTHENFKRLVGLGILAATGRFNANDILDSFARDISMRHIDKFHNNEKVLTFNTAPSPEENAVLKGINDAKSEINLLNKVVRGEIPTPKELSMIADSDVAGYLDRMIKSAFPEDLQSDVFKMAFDLGLPDIDLSLDLGLQIPDWAKIQKVEVPKWAKITGEEEWNKNLQREAENFKNKVIDATTWENFVHLYLKSLWPPNIPLRQVGDGSGNRRYIDTSGFISVREPWNVSHLHPFLQHNLIKQRKSKAQIEYENARDKELESAKRILKEEGRV